MPADLFRQGLGTGPHHPGDRDEFVPLAQSQAVVGKRKACGAPCELVVREGKGHFGPEVAKDMAAPADRFDCDRLVKK